MQILAVDIGTGTQDIFLYDSRLDLENGFKLVVLSPTMIIHQKMKDATQRGQAVLLTGFTMGGGPSQWAVEEHLRAGFQVYATPAAARSFNDDLDAVQSLGVVVVSEDEAIRLPSTIQRVEARDFDFRSIQSALEPFEIKLDRLAAVVVAVFDHGNSPPQYSDRQFRFDYLNQRILSENRLSAFAYLAESIPTSMTRLQAVANSAGDIQAPLVVMDTAPAAILGATYDQLVKTCQQVLIANIGNFHTLAFRLGMKGIEGVFEHHTGLINTIKLDYLLNSLASSTLKHQEVFNDHGHGALIYEETPLLINELPFDVAVTGPRRKLMRASAMRTHFAVPFGDMMMTGCFGLLSAVADLLPGLAEPIRASLSTESDSGKSPWEIS
jgi:uncharacterized protein (DUF1786 family)